jgi:hypothetical protein
MRMPAAQAIRAWARSAVVSAASSAARHASMASDRTAELEQLPAARHEQGEARLVRRGKGEAALDQRQRRGVPELGRDGVARREVGRRRARVLGAVEVLRGEREVARLEPFGGPGVQRAAPLVQQRLVRAVADEGVAEHELAAVGADEEVLDQMPAVVAGLSSRWRSASAANRWPRTAADCSAILSSLAEPSMRAWTSAWIEPGQARLRRLAGVEEELQKKERVAFGALDAAGDDRPPASTTLGRQPARFLGVQGARSMPISGAPWSTVRQPRPSGRRRSASS